MTQDGNGYNDWQQPAAQQVPPAVQQPVYSAPYPPYAAPQPQPQPKKRGWIVALVAVILLFALVALGVHGCTTVLSSSFAGGSSVNEADLLTQDAVGVIDMSGTIQYDGTTCSPEGLKAQLDTAEQNRHIKAIVLRVNSGGGAATAGEEMAAYIKDCSLPVVVASASTNASAAYEISSQADYIYAANTTLIGSIGTIIQFTDLSGLYEKLGINIEDIASAESKDASNGTRPLTDAERAHYQQLVDQINDTFIATVAEGRGMTEDEVRALATGMVFSGIDAVENGLADELGTLEDAVAKAASLAGMSSYTTVQLQPESSDLLSLLDLMSEAGTSGSSNDQLATALKELKANGVL